jgi:2-polyprenyl-6-methoxyphenol hydroxylase-like FAD-dependent oxidoreductase
MLLQNKKIAIVGGGPGGVIIARLLQQAGAEVRIYERDFGKDARVQGATLDLHKDSGLLALQRAGLMNEFYANYRPDAGRIRVVDKQALIRLDDHASNTGYAESRPEIDRAPLRKILLESLLPGSVIWDSQFVSMEQQGSGWLMNFKNGSSAYADLVIGADGANSKIRPYITGIKKVYSGITIVEGNIYNAEQNAPQLWGLLKGGKIFALGGEMSLILSAKGDGCLSFYTGCKVAEDWVKESGVYFNDNIQVAHWFRQTFGDWDDVWQELFAKDDMYCIPRPQYHYPFTQQWTSLPNLTMLGDAAHCMPPYAGEGVNMAMKDAVELADCLTQTSHTTIAAAIADYESKMLQRASEVTQMTLIATEDIHAKDGLNRLLQMF